jgi:hypothetical protein
MNWAPRLRAAGIHLLISLSIAAMAATLVFLLWYPYPYRELSGGRELFTMLVSIDVILGPLLTLSVFNIKKSRAELIRDLTVIGLLQIGALAYGLWTVYEARPVHLVFEFDRFRVAHAADIDPGLLSKAPQAWQHLPMTGPTMLAVRKLSGEESFSATMAALSGAQLSFRPDLWQAYDAEAKARAWAASKPLAPLLKKYPEQSAALQTLAAQSGFSVQQLRYLPAQARDTVWTAVMQPKTGDIIGYLPVDGF